MGIRADSWQSALTKLGTQFDKLTSYKFAAPPRLLTPEECSNLYYFNALAARICDVMPEDALREGVCVKDTKGAEQDDLQTRLKELRAIDCVTDAAVWGNAYGAGCVFLGVDDGLQQLEPLDPERVTAVKFLRAMDRRDLSVATWYGDPLSTKFNQPETFRFVQSSNGSSKNPPISDLIVHESRFLWFEGTRTGQRDARTLNNGWPLSKLQRVYEQLLRVGVSWDNAAQLLQICSQTVMKINGLREAIASDQGAVALEKRALLIDTARSITRSLWVDADGEEVEQLNIPLAGVGDVLDRLGSMLSAATGIPVTKLFGTMPTGLGATGSADERSWNNRVESYRLQDIKPQLEILVACLASELALKDLVVSFPSLDRPTDAETAEIRLKVAQADAIYMTAMAVLPEEVAISRFAGPKYSMDTHLDTTPRALLTSGGVDPNADPELDAAGKPVPPLPGAAGGAASTQSPTERGAPPVTGDKAQDTALNGIQVTSMLQILKDVGSAQIPRESGLAILQVSFRLTTEQAEQILGTIGTPAFKPEPDPLDLAKAEALKAKPVPTSKPPTE